MLFNRRSTILIILAILAVIFLSVAITYYLDYRDNQNMKNRAKTFSEKWLTFEYQSDQKYLAEVKPYLTESFYQTYKESLDSIQNIPGMDQVPKTSSSFSYNSQLLVKNKNKTYTATVKGKQTLKRGGTVTSNKDIELIIEYTKNKSSWLVNNAYIKE